MSKTALHIFHDDPVSIKTVPALAAKIHASGNTSLEVYIFGPAEQMLSKSNQIEFNTMIDKLVSAGVAVTTCIGIAQQIGAEDAFRARKLKLESAIIAFPQFAEEVATVISF